MTADLRALLADAAPGVLSVEVEAEPDDDVPNVYICHLETVCDQTVVCEMRLGGDEPHFVEQRRKTWADLLAAAVNELPALMDAADERDALAAEVKRLRADLAAYATDAQVASCEGCQAPLFEGDDFVSEPDGECSGCWAAISDLPSKRERPCYAYRVGKPSAALGKGDDTGGRGRG